MRILYLPHEYSQQRQFDKPAHIYPVHLAMEAEWYRQNTDWFVEFDPQQKKICSRYFNLFDRIIKEPEGLNFLSLPSPDRHFTRAKDKKYQFYGNYKYHPATHIMSALDCWYARCTFCSWAKKYPDVKTRSVPHVIQEIDECIAMGFKEIFDDAGTIPVGDWLEDLCYELNKRDVVFGCNMRINNDIDFGMMKRAGFRMILFGVESFNQYTLDRLNKGIFVEDIIPCIKRAARAGLEPHIAFMTGYPWESMQDEMFTINCVKDLLIKGHAKTAQASVFDVPNYARDDKGLNYKMYSVALYPQFWINKIKDIKRIEDFLYLMKSIRKGIFRD